MIQLDTYRQEPSVVLFQPSMSAQITQASELPELGYLVGNLDELDARYKCTHCGHLLREPMQGDCGHRYCKNCVFVKSAKARERGEPSLCAACDAAERTEISPDRTYPDNAMKREITKTLRVLCPNRPCEELMLVSKLADHLPRCEFKPQSCELCGVSVAAASLSKHQASECQKRLHPCDVCKKQVPYDTLDDHKANECVGSTIQCEFCGVRVRDTEEARARHVAVECPVGWHDDKLCPYGCTEMKNGWRDHRVEASATHLDILLARTKQQQQQQRDAKQPESEKRLVLGADSSAPLIGASSALAVPAAELASVDYDDLTSLVERIRRMEKRAAEVKLPAAALTGDSGDMRMAQKYLDDLKTAVDQGDKLGHLLDEIRQQFEKCYEKIGQYELRLQKDMEKKLDIDRKHQELVKLLAYKEMKILDLDRRVEVLEHASYDGVLVWKITDVRKRKEEAREGKVCSIYSPPFYTGKAGYKMCGRLYLNGDGAGKNTHISLFFVIMRGAYDALLPWPFSKKVSMMLLDQNFEEHVIDAFKPDTSSSSFKRPTTDMNIASGCPLFMPLQDFENGSRGYVKDDTLFIKFIVDKSDLPA